MSNNFKRSQRKPILHTDQNGKIWKIYRGKDDDGDTDYSPHIDNNGIGIAYGSLEDAIDGIKKYVSKGYKWYIPSDYNEDGSRKY